MEGGREFQIVHAVIRNALETKDRLIRGTVKKMVEEDAEYVWCEIFK